MTHRPNHRDIDPQLFAGLQRHFTEALLPRIARHATVYFRACRGDPERIEELTQQAVANAWKSYLNICLSGRDPSGFLSVLAVRACQGVRHGRKVQGMEKTTSVSNPLLQQREGFRVEALPSSSSASYERLYSVPGGQQGQDALEERLRDNTLTPPPDQAAFRLDYPAWLRRFDARRRRIAEDMATGESTFALAEKHGTTPSRISQMRREFHRDWLNYHGEGPER